MTPREEMVTQKENASIAQIRALAHDNHFDVIPLTDKNNKIVKLYNFQEDKVEELIRDWLISRDTTTPDLLEYFVNSKKPAFFVFSKQKVVGIVTPADLNKIPARVFFYNLVGVLEIALVNLLKEYFGNDETLFLKSLTKTIRDKILQKYEELKSGNTEIDIFQQLYLSDIVKIICGNIRLRELFKIHSRQKCEKLLNGIVDLRNQVMHPSRFLIQKLPDDLLRLNKRVQRLNSILEEVQKLNFF